MTAGLEHPPWCETSTCGVAPGRTGTPIGAHRSRVVRIAGQHSTLVLWLSLWQVVGTMPAPVIAAEVTDARREVGGITLDLDEAREAAHVVLSLVREAQR